MFNIITTDHLVISESTGQKCESGVKLNTAPLRD